MRVFRQRVGSPLAVRGYPDAPKTESEQQGPEFRSQFDGFGMFIAMDPPKHDVQRATVASVVAPRESSGTRRAHS